MKTLTCLGLTLAIIAASLAAQTPAPTPTASTSSSSASELAALEQFLNLSDAELAQMEAVIARLRAMSPAQRAALRSEITAFRQLPEQQRLQLRQGWGGMPAEIQNGWREMMQNATPERRAEIQSRMQSLEPDAKMRYRRDLVEAYLKEHPARK
jgi:DNA-binding transcriptional MerR regulator